MDANKAYVAGGNTGHVVRKVGLTVGGGAKTTAVVGGSFLKGFWAGLTDKPVELPVQNKRVAKRK